ncbi:hypothetical protein QTP88_011616 [Uroleucon formosanum]
MGVLQCHPFVGSVGQERCDSCRTNFIGKVQEESCVLLFIVQGPEDHSDCLVQRRYICSWFVTLVNHILEKHETRTWFKLLEIVISRSTYADLMNDYVTAKTIGKHSKECYPYFNRNVRSRCSPIIITIRMTAD